jgi:predicted nucleic acid-binding protein
MMVEAVNKKLVRPPKTLQKLKERPEKVCQLNDYFTNTMAILDMGIRVHPITAELLRKSQSIRSRYGLLVNDSLIAAIMEEEGIQIMATNDDGFLGIAWIKVYKPSDLILG